MKKQFTHLLLMLAFTFLLAGCNNSSSDSNLTTPKEQPAGWSSTSTGVAYDGSERACF